MKNWLKFITLIVLVLVIDLVTKHFLFDVKYFNLIPNVISVATNGGNDGAAWGMLSGKKITLIIITSIMLIALFIFNHFIKNKNMVYVFGFSFIIGGAIGNLIDRILLGYVRDFIFLDFMPTFPTFNMADSFLCIGCALMVIYILFFSSKKEK